MPYRTLAFAFLVVMALFGRAGAAPPTTLSPDAYGRLPNVDQVTLSPSGEFYAYVNTTDGQRQAVVKTLAGQLKLVAPLGVNKLRNLEWAGDDHLAITESLTGSVQSDFGEYYGSILMNINTKKSFIVFKECPSVFHHTYGFYGSVSRNGHRYGYFGGLTMQKTRGFDPTFNAHSFIELYSVDLDSGGCDIAATGLRYPHQWALDGSGAVVAHALYDTLSEEWTLRPGVEGGAPLATLHEPLGEVTLVGLGRTPGTVIVHKAAPEEWSLSDGRHTPLATEGPVDRYMFDPTSRRLLGVSLGGDQPRQQFFDPVLNARQAAFRRALGGEPAILSWSADFKRLILFTEASGDAGTYWLVDGGSVKPLAYRYPDIPDANVGSSRAVIYKAADGLEIHGVLTLPPGRTPKDLPVVVIPHGGPEEHDQIGFDWIAQAFAGQGYAVFQPNFRGSSGYGREFRDAGFGQWGRKMQSDISDGLAELARQGIINPARACTVGATRYGGYAALAGVTLQHGLYRCAVSYAGLGDMSTYFDMVASSEGRSAQSRYYQKFLGAQRMGDSVLGQISPAAFADRADAPILLMHGEDDTVVPISQSREMERKLRAAGKPVELLTFKSEDHWLSRDITRRQVLSAAIAFVEKNNPPD